MMAISLYTTRVVLETLGIIDYGIYNVAGGVVGFITMITGALTLSVQRFLNFEIGKGAGGNVSEVFTSAIYIQIAISLVLFAILETIGYYYFKTSINIPVDKYNAALAVFHFSSITACVTIAFAPFSAMIIAYERMDIFAYLSIVDAVLKLAIVYLLLSKSTGRLVFYSELMLGASCIYALINWFVCRVKFPHVKITRSFNRGLFKQIFSFASWSALGQMAWAFTLQGCNILLNLFFGNILNAAYGVTSQVQAAVTKFVQSFQTALNPQIVKKYAENDIQEVGSLLFYGTKFSCFLLLIICIPLFYEMDVILNLWLDEVPDFTLIFCRISLINIILDAMSNLFATVIQAYGKIRKYQIVVSAILFLNFPLSYLALEIWNIPYLIYIVYGTVSILLLFVRERFVSKALNKSLFRPFVCNVLLPVLKVLVFALPLCYIAYLLCKNLSPFSQILSVSSICICFIGLVILCIGLTGQERKRIAQLVKSRLHK